MALFQRRILSSSSSTFGSCDRLAEEGLVAVIQVKEGMQYFVQAENCSYGAFGGFEEVCHLNMDLTEVGCTAKEPSQVLFGNGKVAGFASMVLGDVGRENSFDSIRWPPWRDRD